MAARRSRIVDAASVLIRETGGTEFTMVNVAGKAEVSPATPYNLFGSKNGVLYALLNRSLDEVFAGTLHFASPSPVEHAVEAGDIAAQIFARDPVFYRPLFLVLLGVRDEVHRPRFMERSLEFWTRSLDAMAEGGMLDGTERDDLARALLIHFAGVLELWIHGDLDEAGFRAQVSYGISLHVLGLASGTDRARLLRRMKEAKRHLPRRFSFMRPPRGTRRTA